MALLQLSLSLPPASPLFSKANDSADNPFDAGLSEGGFGFFFFLPAAGFMVIHGIMGNGSADVMAQHVVTTAKISFYFFLFFVWHAFIFSYF